MSMYRGVATPYVHDEIYMPPLARAAHASHSLRCITGLPDSLVDVDASRYAQLSRRWLYQLHCGAQPGTILLLHRVLGYIRCTERESQHDHSKRMEKVVLGAANQYTPCYRAISRTHLHMSPTGGPHGSGFKPSSFMTGQGPASEFVRRGTRQSCPTVYLLTPRCSRKNRLNIVALTSL